MSWVIPGQLTLFPAHNDYKAEIFDHYESLFIEWVYVGRGGTTV